MAGVEIILLLSKLCLELCEGAHRRFSSRTAVVSSVSIYCKMRLNLVLRLWREVQQQYINSSSWFAATFGRISSK